MKGDGEDWHGRMLRAFIAVCASCERFEVLLPGGKVFARWDKHDAEKAARVKRWTAGRDRVWRCPSCSGKSRLIERGKLKGVAGRGG